MSIPSPEATPSPHVAGRFRLAMVGMLREDVKAGRAANPESSLYRVPPARLAQAVGDAVPLVWYLGSSIRAESLGYLPLTCERWLGWMEQLLLAEDLLRQFGEGGTHA